MPSSTAFLKAVMIVTYFAVSTAWLPNQLLRLGPIAGVPRLVGDLIATSVWAAALVLGLWALRRLQGRGSI